METHKRILGTIYLVYACFILVILVLMYFVFFGVIFSEEFNHGVSDYEANIAFSVIRWVFLFILVVFVIPSIVGGVALLNNYSWAMTVLVIEGCLSLFSFPIGTILGGYTLWVFFKEQELKRAGVTGEEDFERRSN